ncbi:MAG: carboxypeptidase-like regulatory domain-containing protein [Acidobacteriota bacterium]|nr:carboxypeptidase-like regulatory domain-containing protein [Acidobacteriota bacterium]
MFTKISLVGFGLIVAVGAGVTAQQMVPPESTLKFVQVWRPSTVTGQTQIIGMVIDIFQVPVANAKVRLRNLNTGRIEQLAETNELGEYAFEVVEPGTYVVETVMIDGTIIAR